MFEDEYVEVAHESWFGRLRDSCMGIVFGLLFFVVGFPLLFWNEGRAVQTFKTLQEGAGSVVSIGAASVRAVLSEQVTDWFEHLANKVPNSAP